MKRIISVRSALVYYSFSVLVLWGFSLVPLVLAVFGGEVQKIGEGLLFFCVLFGFGCFPLWFLNRTACVVWIEDGVVKRKGLIFGFYKECPVRSIRIVRVRYSPHSQGSGSFVYLIDDNTQPYKKFLRTRKDGYISFRRTRKNLEFLRSFWDGPLDE